MKTAISLFVLFGAIALAQTTGELRGSVKDPSHLAASGARVTATFDATGTIRNALTDANGEFAFLSVPVGQYTVEVEADGAKSYVRRYLEVTLGHVIDVAVQLEAGDATKVLALDAPLVERSSTQIGAVVNAQTVVTLL